ncbi:hypothetical protein BG000_011016 [Podila horticola]|nr:hypothetical protein BG000_011016 [Podila horticola]
MIGIGRSNEENGDILAIGVVGGSKTVIIPKVYGKNRYDLEGEQIKLIPAGQGDTEHITYLDIPSKCTLYRHLAHAKTKNAKEIKEFVLANNRNVVPGHLDGRHKWTTVEMVDYPIKYIATYEEALKMSTSEKFWNRVMSDNNANDASLVVPSEEKFESASGQETGDTVPEESQQFPWTLLCEGLHILAKELYVEGISSEPLIATGIAATD